MRLCKQDVRIIKMNTNATAATANLTPLFIRRLLTTALAFLFLPLSAAAPLTTCDQLRTLQLNKSSFILLDVRPPEQFTKGHIQNALNIPAADVGTNDLPKKHIIIYCDEHPCPLTESSAQKLQVLNYDVSILDGGLNAWLKRGYPLTSQTNSPSRAKHPKLTAKYLRRHLKDSLLIDVRPPLEYSAGHLPGAKNFPLENLDPSQFTTNNNTPLIIYDRLSSRSSKAVQKLSQAGLNVQELSGGVAAWIKAKGTLEVNP